MIDDLSKCTLLVVEDVEANVDVLVDALGDAYEVSVAMDAKSAFDAIRQEMPNIILLDIILPDMSGFEVCRKLKADPATSKIPVIFLTAMSEIQDKTKGFECGAVDYITKPIDTREVQVRVKTHLQLQMASYKLEQQNVILEKRVRERTRELALTQDVTIQMMGTLAEYRDPETGGHIKRTQHYIRLLGEHLQFHPKFRSYLDNGTIELLFKSAPLHDIGKVGVPDNILLKPGPLTEEEFKEIKKHTLYGRDTILSAEKKLGNGSFLRYARDLAYSHHEKWDGTGYPQGLKGEEIPIAGRMMAIADTYDALISKRVYKPPIPHEIAVMTIMQGDGRTMPYHFEPEMLMAFMELEETFRQVAYAFADFDEERSALAK